MFGLLASSPSYNQIIKPFIALAPVVTGSHCKSPIRHLSNIITSIPNPLLEKMSGRFMPENAILKFLVRGIPTITTPIVNNLNSIVHGHSPDQLDLKNLTHFGEYFPAGTSSKNIVHFAQVAKSAKFRKFDYGKEKNLELYLAESPSEYCLEDITNPNIALIYGANDLLAPPEEVEWLRKHLKVKPILDVEIEDKKWNHVDFVIGKDVGKYVNAKIVKLLSELC